MMCTDNENNKNVMMPFITDIHYSIMEMNDNEILISELTLIMYNAIIIPIIISIMIGLQNAEAC